MEGTMMGVQPTMPIGNDSFGGSSWLMVLLVIILLGGGGFGFGGRNQAATTDELSAGFNFAGINNKLNEINASVAGVNQNLGNAICSSTYELASKIDNGNYQTLLAIKELGANIKEDKIADLQQQITAMQIQQATCGLPKVSAYAWGVYPYTCGTCSSQQF